MYAIDTNIVIRFLTQDDEKQHQKAKQIIQTQEVFISDTVILEIEWVLRYAYGFNVTEISDALLLLLNACNVYMTDKNKIFHAINWYKGGLDFGDALHLANSQHCLQFITFDLKLIKCSQSRGQCPVVSP
jgi:predicted nucleic-acid-binding protein